MTTITKYSLLWVVMLLGLGSSPVLGGNPFAASSEPTTMPMPVPQLTGEINKLAQGVPINFTMLPTRSAPPAEASSKQPVYYGTLTLHSDGTTGKDATVITITTNNKMVKAAYLGIDVRPADATLRSQLKLTPGVGLIITNLDEEGPAEKAGLRVHDLIYKLDDQLAINEEQFTVLVRSHEAGQKLELTIVREGMRMVVPIVPALKDLPELSTALDEIRAANPASGVQLQGRSISVELPKGATLLEQK